MSTRQKSLYNTITRLSNEQLLDMILIAANDYTEEAIDIARKELKRRNIECDSVEELKKVKQNNNDGQEEISDVPLSMWGKFFCVSIPVIALLVWICYPKNKIRERKETLQFALYGAIAALVFAGILGDDTSIKVSLLLFAVLLAVIYKTKYYSSPKIIKDIKEIEISNENICSQCGTNFEKGDKYCGSCGSEIIN